MGNHIKTSLRFPSNTRCPFSPNQHSHGERLPAILRIPHEMNGGGVQDPGVTALLRDMLALWSCQGVGVKQGYA